MGRRVIPECTSAAQPIASLGRLSIGVTVEKGEGCDRENFQVVVMYVATPYRSLPPEILDDLGYRTLASTHACRTSNGGHLDGPSRLCRLRQLLWRNKEA